MRAWCLVLVFAVFARPNSVDAIDSASEKDYDSELDDEIDDLQAAQSLQDDREYLLELDENDGFYVDDDEEENLLDEIKEEILEEFQEDVEKRTLKTRINNMMHKVVQKHGISAPYKQNGSCSTFRGHAHSIHTCTSEKTRFGDIKACKVTCAKGFHLLHGIPHYELCGAATEWRWTYQLRGKSKAVEKCLKGSSKKAIPTSCTTAGCVSSAAYYINKIDFTVDPCEDFFQYGCGRWLKETPYPPSSSGMIETYSIIRNRVKKDMAKLLGQPAKKSDIESIKKVKVAYKACMDTDLIDKLDSKPLLELLKDEIAWPVIDDTWDVDQFDLEKSLGTLRGLYHNDILFKVKVLGEKRGYILSTSKGKTAMHYKYYIEGKYASRKNAYFSLMTEVATMLGADKEKADSDMADVLQFETQIALLKVLNHDYPTYKTIGQMDYQIPGINWLALFTRMIMTSAVTKDTLVDVRNMKYLQDMIKTIQDTNKRVVQNYMVWRFVKHRIDNLSQRFQLVNLKFQKAMTGKKKLHKRYYFCAMYLDYTLKGPTGKMFVDEYFTPAKKATARNMFEHIRHAFIYLLDTEVDWMDKRTKEYAKEKAEAITPYIGYNPDIYENTTYLDEEWKDLVVKKNDYFGNVLRILTGISQNSFAKLGTAPPEPGQNMRPTMVNAFYSPSHNSITLPAGELQYPFYWGDEYPRMFQYGGIGTILGHEITHGFDNEGAKHDKYGRMRNWWTSNSLIQFHKRTGCIENQYSNYYWKSAGENLNGKRTLGENIADNGGIRESYFGYQRWLKSKKKTGEEIEPATGLTNDQMFFVGFANVRCAKYSHRAAVHQTATSVHAPGRFRVVGSLQNFAKFSDAFHCPAKSYMNPTKKCIIW